MKPTTESSVIKVPGFQFLPAAFAVVPLKTGAQVCAGIAVGGYSHVIVCISVFCHEESISRFLDRFCESSTGFSGISHFLGGYFTVFGLFMAYLDQDGPTVLCLLGYSGSRKE